MDAGDAKTGSLTLPRPPWRNVGAVATGGAIGASLRYQLGLWFPTPALGFPLTTLAINVSGSFALAVVLTLTLERWPPTKYVRAFVATGVLGAYTTFSTLSVDASLLIKDGRVVLAIGDVVLSVTTGMAAAVAGVAMVRLSSRTKGSTP